MEAEPRPLGLAAGIALATGMGRGEACAPGWSDPSDGGTITVSRAPGDGDGGSHVKGPRTGSPAKTIPSPSTWTRCSPPNAATRSARRPLHTGNAGGGGPPRNPTRLGEDLSALRRVGGLSCALHDPRRALATMMMAGGCDVRTMASCLGHASASMAPDIHAGVDPEAERAAVDKAADSLDADLDPLYGFPSPTAAPSAAADGLTLSVGQLRAMFAAAEGKGTSHGRP